LDRIATHPKLSGKNGVGSYATVHQKLVRAAPEPFAEPNVQIAKAANNPFSNTLTSPWHRPQMVAKEYSPVDGVNRNVAIDAVPTTRD